MCTRIRNAGRPSHSPANTIHLRFSLKTLPCKTKYGTNHEQLLRRICKQPQMGCARLIYNVVGRKCIVSWSVTGSTWMEMSRFSLERRSSVKQQADDLLTQKAITAYYCHIYRLGQVESKGMCQSLLSSWTIDPQRNASADLSEYDEI